MSDDAGSRSQLDAAPSDESHGEPLDELPPLDDPYLIAPPPAPRAETSTLAVSSVVAALLLGPVGAVAAIVLGWAARREIHEAPGRRGGYGLATAGLALGVALTVAWGAALPLVVWTWRAHREQLVDIERTVEAVSAPQVAPSGQTPPAAESPAGSVPARTAIQRVGAVTVVDVGVDASSLSEELARQRAEAFGLGEKVLVMTTRGPCDPCRGVETSLRDPLMQTALHGVRLIRVDIDVFKDDLEELKVPAIRYPGFFLLSLDLTPQDGIDGGEWDDDIAQNIAPVLGAFVRGQYTRRRAQWKPLPGSGMRL
ncbi:MAG: DUF4190 domain-containing protein [Polyangiaceae bacterium]|nr:DUF4190 domain-containing protein [Polyangiaceae bacterium]